jgi:exodeoxyribonuclease-3
VGSALTCSNGGAAPRSTPIKVASFNINGIKARLPALLDWLRDADTDVVVLQGIKATDDQFPRLEIEELGYAVETHGQKGFNGVAILSRLPLEDVRRGLPGDDGDEQSRWIEALVAAPDGGGAPVRVCGLYLPNGNPAPGPKYDYKLAWMARLQARAAAMMAAEETAVILGDYNVIPEPKDCWNPAAWKKDALFLPPTRAAFRRLVNLGLTDALRAVDQGPGIYTFWDYQAGAFQKNWGIRIDHVLLTPGAADRLETCGIDAETRSREKPSDHVPIWVTLA